ncbi:Putative TolA protein [Vulgatibacter incomptus]|uniref:Putative TolA protein n=2 Tax=Vulgatibacter incomptus TaxID=1391653 RepID=A0A0K1P8H4_9BACT|nr:Putative TolA protein [Vulgatibacter incomptus]
MARKRLLVALVLAALFHLVAIPLTMLSFRFEPGKEPEVALVRIPASQWDAAAGVAREGAKQKPPMEKAEAAKEKEQETPPPEEKKKEPEKAPGQVVETAPGNGETSPDSKFSAESNNRVDKQTISRDRRAGANVTTPKATAPAADAGAPGEEAGQSVGVVGEAGKDKGKAQKARGKVEIPSVERKDELSMKVSPNGAGKIPNQKGSDELQGNSDRFRIQVGEGDGEEEREGGGGTQPGGELKLFPSAAVVDRITGAPAPDHVEGVDEGEGTFLNTREWRFASFMNRLKAGVARTWDPSAVARVRDPSGNIYLWKDRYTLLSVTLREDGSLEGAYVEKSSGVDFLDREAMAAFERAQPFPHPPKGLMGEDGRIHFQFGFFIDTNRGGIRIFRR